MFGFEVKLLNIEQIFFLLLVIDVFVSNNVKSYRQLCFHTICFKNDTAKDKPPT